MRISRQQWFEILGAIVGLAVAFGGIELGFFAIGRPGAVLLLVSVPVGLLIGWLFVKAFEFVARMISESD